MKKNALTTLALSLMAALTSFSVFSQTKLSTDSIQYANEKHFKNIQQLTFGGDNAEGYFSHDGKYVIFQRSNPKEGINCDQMFIGKLPEKYGDPFTYKMVSSGKGRTTCGYFLPDGKHIIYGSTHLGGDTCPPLPDRSKYGNKYIWPIYDSYDIFLATTDGKIVKQLTATKGYDAEGTLSPDGKKMIFTSVRDGDLDLYIMDLKTYKVTRITHELGYDGGAWFSPDGKKIVWRASRPKTKEEIEEYKTLLKDNLVAPTHMEVYVANADGSNPHQITFLEQANWAPNFTPDGKHIIFCSNHEYPRGFPFNMYLTDINGNGLEKVSRDKGFDAFPMFSSDGKKVLFSSNRNNGGQHGINLFVADWVN